MTGIKAIVAECEACVHPGDASLEKESRHMGAKSLVVLLSESAGADSTFVGEQKSDSPESFPTTYSQDAITQISAL
jgi:hypothetical protein